MLTYCGIDPGANTGVAVVNNDCLVKTAVIRTRAKDSMDARVFSVFDGLVQIVSQYKPDVIFIEGMRRFGVVRSSLKSTVIQAMFHGAVLAAVGYARPEGSRVMIVPPPRVQWAGRGKTKVVGHPTKQSAYLLCRQVFGKVVADRLSEHELDALSLCIYYQNQQKEGGKNGKTASSVRTD